MKTQVFYQFFFQRFLGNVQFRDEDLMDIFSTCSSDCNTHDLLECTCGGNGILPTEVDDDDSSGCLYVCYVYFDFHRIRSGINIH